MSVYLQAKSFYDFGFAEELPREECAPLETALLENIPSIQIENQEHAVRRIELDQCIDDGILCNLELENGACRRFIPKTFFSSLDLENLFNGVDPIPLNQLKTLTEKVKAYWKSIRNSFCTQFSCKLRKTIDDPPPELIFSTRPTALLCRVKLSGLTEKQDADCLQYEKQEIVDWTDRQYVETFFEKKTKAALTNEDLLLFQSGCVLNSSYWNQIWKLTQSGIEKYFKFLPVVERVMYADWEIDPSPRADRPEGDESEQRMIVREELFCAN